MKLNGINYSESDMIDAFMVIDSQIRQGYLEIADLGGYSTEMAIMAQAFDDFKRKYFTEYARNTENN